MTSICMVHIYCVLLSLYSCTESADLRQEAIWAPISRRHSLFLPDGATQLNNIWFFIIYCCIKNNIDRIQNLKSYLFYFLLRLFIVADKSKSFEDICPLLQAPVIYVLRFVVMWKLHMEFVVTQSSIRSLCSIFIAYYLHNKFFLLVMLWLNFQLTIIKLLPKACRKLCSIKIMLIFFLCFHGIFRQSSIFIKFPKLVPSVCSKYEL